MMKLRTKVASVGTNGCRDRKVTVRPSGTRTLRISNVITMANTPSLKASRRVLFTVEETYFYTAFSSGSEAVTLRLKSLLNVSGTSALLEQLESVRPLVTQEARDTPQHAQWFDCTCGFGFTHVCRFPSELIQYRFDRFLCGVIVTANEHRRFTRGELWIHHARIPARVEGFHKPRVRKLTL